MPLAAVPRIESSSRARHAPVRLIDRARLVRLADGFALLCAVALPWSTSAVRILVVLWLGALIPTLNFADGTIVVVQTVVSSLFNSYMFDFGSGQSYVWAVGVLGGTALKKTNDPVAVCGAPVPSPRPRIA